LANNNFLLRFGEYDELNLRAKFPAVLLREVRRQETLDTLQVPAVCVLDPDGNLVRQLRLTGMAKPADTFSSTISPGALTGLVVVQLASVRCFNRRKPSV
jgi:hypothetical protein